MRNISLRTPPRHKAFSSFTLPRNRNSRAEATGRNPCRTVFAHPRNAWNSSCFVFGVVVAWPKPTFENARIHTAAATLVPAENISFLIGRNSTALTPRSGDSQRCLGNRNRQVSVLRRLRNVVDHKI